MKRFAFCLAVLAWLWPPPEASALLCTPILGCSCSVSASDMNFGAIQPLANTAAAATSDVSVACSGVIDVAPSVSAKIGAGAHGVTGDRKMISAASNVLHYNIYSSTLYSTILGDGTGGFPSLTVSGGLITLGNWSATVHLYGRVPADSTVPPGDYSDAVIVRIDW